VHYLTDGQCLTAIYSEEMDREQEEEEEEDDDDHNALWTVHHDEIMGDVVAGGLMADSISALEPPERKQIGSGFRMEQPLRLRMVSVKHDSIALEWNRPEFEAERFEVVMRIGSNVDAKGQDQNQWHLVYEGTATNYVVPSLRPETDYLFKARYRCLYGVSPWPKAVRFRTTKGDGKESEDGNGNGNGNGGVGGGSGGGMGRKHAPILSNVEIAAKEREFKKMQKRNRRENRKKQEEDERRKKKEDAEQQRAKRAANKRKKARAKQEAAKRKKEEEERAKREEDERERASEG